MGEVCQNAVPVCQPPRLSLGCSWATYRYTYAQYVFTYTFRACMSCDHTCVWFLRGLPTSANTASLVLAFCRLNWGCDWCWLSFGLLAFTVMTGGNGLSWGVHCNCCCFNCTINTNWVKNFGGLWWHQILQSVGSVQSCIYHTDQWNKVPAVIG